MKLAVLSNVNLDLLIRKVSKKHTVFETDGYGQWIPYALKSTTTLEEFAPKIIFVFLDGTALLESCEDYESGCEKLKEDMECISLLPQNYPHSTIAVSTIDVQRCRISSEMGMELLWEAEWCRLLRAEEKKTERLILLDMQSLVTQKGRDSVYSNKMWYMGSIPYAVSAIDLWADAVFEFSQYYEQPRRKLLVIDLDQTIWGGVVGEDGPEGIILSESLLGAAYRDAQKRIREIAQTGVLLAVVSKNNQEDVDEVFQKNRFMVLQRSDFVSIVANWNEKYINVKELCQALNIGTDSVVFLDDNVVEREAMRLYLPEVAVADFPNDPSALPKAVVALYEKYFKCWKQTAEDKSKTLMYQQNAQRHQAQQQIGSLEDYLKYLQISITIHEVTDAQVGRAVQLINKTNQFNTNTVRMDLDELLQYCNAPSHQVLVVEVSDRFGDSGLVSVLLLREEGEVTAIDNFLMSCRVMGRQIENAIIAALEVREYRRGQKALQSSYVPTAKNRPVADLWDRLGFQRKEQSEERKEYEMCLPAQTKTLLEAKWEE